MFVPTHFYVAGCCKCFCSLSAVFRIWVIFGYNICGIINLIQDKYLGELVVKFISTSSSTPSVLEPSLFSTFECYHLFPPGLNLFYKNWPKNKEHHVRSVLYRLVLNGVWLYVFGPYKKEIHDQHDFQLLKESPMSCI